LGGAAAASLGLWPERRLGAQPSAPARASRDLGDGVHVLTPGRTNVLAVTDSGGVALVDGGSAAEAETLAQMLSGMSGGKVHTLFNTHWHPDHTGSNERVAEAGAKIVSQVNTKHWLGTDVTWPWNNETVEPLPNAALPSETFFDETELTVGGRQVRCGHLRDCPHTDGDMYVYFPEPNVMAVGDAVYGEGWPLVDWWTGGWIGGLVGGLDMILSVSNDRTRFVPARGPVLDRAAMLEQYKMYGVIWERLAKLLYTGAGPEDAVAAAPTKEFEAKMGPSDEFVRQAFKSMWAYLSPDD
jgi:glyoxylase-like metal-dependent hydrolase (beta-lactamase superfamily II)